MTQAERTSLAADSAEKDTSRLEAFSDGVFAIAITLLVLDLKVPSLIDLKVPSLTDVTPAILAGALWAKRAPCGYW